MDDDPSPPSPFWSGLKYGAVQMARGTGLYAMTLAGRRAPPPVVIPPDPFAGDPERGAQIIDGAFTFAGERIAQARNPWSAIGAGPGWLEAVNGFGWLRDLVAYGGQAAQDRARTLVADWIAADQGGKLEAGEIAWRADVTGRRVWSWLIRYPWLVDGASEAERAALLDSIARQVRHLSRVAGHEGRDEGRLGGIMGYVVACLCLPNWAEDQREAVGLLGEELSRAILPDGCHATRSPQVQLQVLKDLTGLRAAFQDGQQETPASLQTAIDRMAPMVRFFRHGDGGLTLFNNSREGDAVEIDSVLALADARGRPPKRAPHGGFERLVAGRLTAFMDVGAPPKAGYDGHAHAGALSLEVSAGPDRLIVNCGAALRPDGQWSSAQRATAAHSVLGVDDTNSSQLLSGSNGTTTLGKRRARTECARQEAEDGIWLEAAHDGYARNFGLTYQRRLYLSSNGDDLRGEEILEGAEGHAFTLRFHLHPKVQVSLLHNHTAALLRPPSGQGWRLRVAGGDMALTDSVYLGRGDGRRAQQIILTGITGPEATTIKWALQREVKKG
jgi:uncharacterized heparinase superfamily protein